jgi:microcystin-dependent protein
MSDPFLAEIRMGGFNFPPRGWASCNGQLMPISQYDAVFALVGTIYGGDGQITFALPDLRGRVPVHQGQGPGRSNRFTGERSGSEQETLTTPHLPTHVHPLGPAGTLPTVQGAANSATPAGARPARPGDGEGNYSSAAEDGGIGLGGTTSVAGGSLPHANLPPFLTVNFSIALEGIFPQRI